jgi:hypothetical protein
VTPIELLAYLLVYDPETKMHYRIQKGEAVPRGMRVVPWPTDAVEMVLRSRAGKRRRAAKGMQMEPVA